jgi:hypothetical protein
MDRSRTNMVAFMGDWLSTLVNTAIVSRESATLPARMGAYTANMVSLMTCNFAAIFLSRHLLVAEGAMVNARVTRQAIVVALMKSALDTKQVADSTL